jgi:uncharacterized protein
MLFSPIVALALTPGLVTPVSSLLVGSRRTLDDPLALGRWAMSICLITSGVAAATVVAGGGSVGGGLARISVTAAVVASAVLLDRRGQLVSRLVAIGVGLVGFAIGDALGYGRRPALPLSARSLAASVLLVTSAALVLTASVSLILALKGWPKRIGATAALALCLIAIRSVFVTPVAEAIRLTNVVRLGVPEVTPGDYRLTFEEVSFRTEDGTWLAGWYVPSSNGTAVIVAHGMGSNRAGVLEHGAILADHGFGVLMFDTRGQGRSEGRGMDLGWYGETNLGGAISYLAGRGDVDPSRIAILGLSLGGEEALGAAAADDRVRAVVADGATYRRLGDWTPGHDGRLLDRAAEWVMFTTVDLLSDRSPPIRLRDAVREISPRPVLLIASGAGNEIEAAHDLQRSSQGNVDVWDVPDAGHVQELETHRDAWTATVVNFLRAALAE